MSVPSLRGEGTLRAELWSEACSANTADLCTDASTQIEHQTLLVHVEPDFVVCALVIIDEESSLFKLTSKASFPPSPSLSSNPASRPPSHPCELTRSQILVCQCAHKKNGSFSMFFSK